MDKEIRRGTLFCKLFGHKMFVRSKNPEVGEGNDRVRCIDFCIRCGIGRSDLEKA